MERVGNLASGYGFKTDSDPAVQNAKYADALVAKQASGETLSDNEKIRMYEAKMLSGQQLTDTEQNDLAMVGQRIVTQDANDRARDILENFFKDTKAQTNAKLAELALVDIDKANELANKVVGLRVELAENERKAAESQLEDGVTVTEIKESSVLDNVQDVAKMAGKVWLKGYDYMTLGSGTLAVDAVKGVVDNIGEKGLIDGLKQTGRDIAGLYQNKKVLDQASKVLSVTPYIGDAKDIQEAILGRDLITGDKIEGLQYAATLFGAVLPVVNSKAAREVTRNFSEGFEKFSQLKKSLGPAGEGMEWHHLVEQSQIKKSGFDSRDINNIENIIAIPKDIHHQVSGFFGSKPDFTNNLRVRDWLADQGKNFQEQFEFGRKMLGKFGTIKKSEKGWELIPK